MTPPSIRRTPHPSHEPSHRAQEHVVPVPVPTPAAFRSLSLPPRHLPTATTRETPSPAPRIHSRPRFHSTRHGSTLAPASTRLDTISPGALFSVFSRFFFPSPQRGSVEHHTPETLPPISRCPGSSLAPSPAPVPLLSSGSPSFFLSLSLRFGSCLRASPLVSSRAVSGSSRRLCAGACAALEPARTPSPNPPLRLTRRRPPAPANLPSRPFPCSFPSARPARFRHVSFRPVLLRVRRQSPSCAPPVSVVCPGLFVRASVGPFVLWFVLWFRRAPSLAGAVVRSRVTVVVCSEGTLASTYVRCLRCCCRPVERSCCRVLCWLDPGACWMPPRVRFPQRLWMMRWEPRGDEHDARCDVDVA